MHLLRYIAFLVHFVLLTSPLNAMEKNSIEKDEDFKKRIERFYPKLAAPIETITEGEKNRIDKVSMIIDEAVKRAFSKNIVYEKIIKALDVRECIISDCKSFEEDPFDITSSGDLIFHRGN